MGALSAMPALLTRMPAPAPECLRDARDDARHFARVRHVARRVHRLHAALISDLCGDARHLLRRARHDRNACARAREGESDGAPNAATAAGDDCDFIFEFQVSSFKSLKSARLET